VPGVSALATALGLFALQSASIVPERPLRAEPAAIGDAGRVEMDIGAWYVTSSRLDSIGTPARLSVNITRAFQFRIQTVGMIGRAEDWWDKAELRDGQIGAQYQFMGVGEDRYGKMDAAFRARVVGLHPKKHRGIFTGLFSRVYDRSSIDLNLELSVPFNDQSRSQIPLLGTAALGGRQWWSDTWGGAAGYVFEWPEAMTARHRVEAAFLARLGRSWVFDAGAEYQFSPWTRWIFKAGLSFMILQI
jgi:hypothetical protein